MSGIGAAAALIVGETPLTTGSGGCDAPSPPGPAQCRVGGSFLRMVTVDASARRSVLICDPSSLS